MDIMSNTLIKTQNYMNNCAIYNKIPCLFPMIISLYRHSTFACMKDRATEGGNASFTHRKERNGHKDRWKE